MSSPSSQRIERQSSGKVPLMFDIHKGGSFRPPVHATIKEMSDEDDDQNDQGGGDSISSEESFVYDFERMNEDGGSDDVHGGGDGGGGVGGRRGSSQGWLLNNREVDANGTGSYDLDDDESVGADGARSVALWNSQDNHEHDQRVYQQQQQQQQQQHQQQYQLHPGASPLTQQHILQHQQLQQQQQQQQQQQYHNGATLPLHLSQSAPQAQARAQQRPQHRLQLKSFSHDEYTPGEGDRNSSDGDPLGARSARASVEGTLVDRSSSVGDTVAKFVPLNGLQPIKGRAMPSPKISHTPQGYHNGQPFGEALGYGVSPNSHNRDPSLNPNLTPGTNLPPGSTLLFPWGPPPDPDEMRGRVSSVASVFDSGRDRRRSAELSDGVDMRGRVASVPTVGSSPGAWLQNNGDNGYNNDYGGAQPGGLNVGDGSRGRISSVTSVFDTSSSRGQEGVGGAGGGNDGVGEGGGFDLDELHYMRSRTSSTSSVFDATGRRERYDAMLGQTQGQEQGAEVKGHGGKQRRYSVGGNMSGRRPSLRDQAVSEAEDVALAQRKAQRQDGEAVGRRGSLTGLLGRLLPSIENMNEVDEVNGDGLDAVGSAAFCCCQPKTMAIHGALASVTMVAYIFFPTYGVYFGGVYLTIIATHIVFVVIMVAHGPRGQRCCSCCPQWCSCNAASKRLEASQQMIELPQIDVTNDHHQMTVLEEQQQQRQTQQSHRPSFALPHAGATQAQFPPAPPTPPTPPARAQPALLAYDEPPRVPRRHSASSTVTTLGIQPSAPVKRPSDCLSE